MLLNPALRDGMLILLSPLNGIPKPLPLLAGAKTKLSLREGLTNPLLRNVAPLMALPLKGVPVSASLLGGRLMLLLSLKGLLDIPPLLLGSGLTDSLFLRLLTTPLLLASVRTVPLSGTTNVRGLFENVLPLLGPSAETPPLV